MELGDMELGVGVGVRRVGDWQAIVLSIVTIISGISSVRWLVDCNMYPWPHSHPPVLAPSTSDTGE
eukprot:CAMPEP_0119468764 /NCGR_PEP_ID=MMETSP1344-20130328/2379_1 /TAXON_ID=236787 /ORGANISM="Florenciella parvula, Strain CCMP2471" /LENGTH=65 /DNA_ID=CAMNT_0007501257 /DNA_START=1 /DNA_END=198 /DNA_ORIENTATION=+